MTSLRAKADSVRAEVTSISTCTLATATALADLLSSSTCSIGTEDEFHSKPPSDRAPASKSRLARAPKSRSAVTVTAKIDGHGRSELSPKDRAILATEVINVTLKSLTSSAMAAPSTRRQPSKSEAMRSPRRKALRRSTSLPQSPLQQRSLNRVSSSPNIGTRGCRSSSSASITSSTYRPMAECSRIAFACMRSLQTSRTPCMMDMLPLQLENGMSALAGRLILLGLDDLAIKELRILKRRLDAAIGSEPGRDKIARQNSTKYSAKTGITQTLVDLIDFEISPSGGPLLLLVVTTQVQIVRLVASSKDPNLATAMLSKLRMENQGSPFSLLLKFANQSPDQANKAAKQLEMLSQLLLSICPSISSSADVAIIMPKPSVPPQIALGLQTLAFQGRILWWKFCNNQGDVETDVLGPFSKCLAAFTRRSKGHSLQTYRFASSAFQTIQDIIVNHGFGGSRPSFTSMYKILGSLAQDASCLDEATKWLLEAHNNFELGSVSDVQGCSTAASLLSLKLLTSAPDAEIEELLLFVLEGLEGPLKGESSELDDLLSEISKLRKTVLSLLYKQNSPPDTSATPKLSAGVRQMCESLILLCPRFSIRYLGKQPEPSSAPRIIVRHEQRRQFLAKSAFHAIDSSIFLLRSFQSEKRLTWELLDSNLQDCLRLLERIDDKPQRQTSNTTGATSYYVRISHLYFTQHLNMRRDVEHPKNILHLRPLRRSIDCVSALSPAEKIASSVNSKLERLADLYKIVGRHEDVRETLVRLHGELSKCDTLSSIASAGCSESLTATWEITDDVSTLARVIASLTKLELRSGSKSLGLPLYDISLPDTEKGLVLEYILEVLSRQPKESQGLQKYLFLELLSIYDLQTFPVRRLRVISRLLQLDPDQRRSLTDDVKNTLAISKLGNVLENSKDNGLLSYLPHLQALTSSILELQEEHPRADLFKPHLAWWSSTLEACKSIEALARIVDDVPKLISHLLSIADFLHMKGINKMRTGVLRMIANLYQLSRPDPGLDGLVLSQTYLGLQYLELGYSAKAGLSLDKAQAYASCNGVSPEALLEMHLACAEHSISNGQADRCEEILLRVQDLTLQNPDLLVATKCAGGLTRRTRITALAARAFLVHSLLSIHRGAPAIALGHAKKSVKLIRYSWVKIAARIQSKVGVMGTTVVDSLADDVLNLSISNNTSPTTSAIHDYPPDLSAWALVNPLFRGLLHLSALYAYQGMFQETTYYAEQAHSLVKLVDSGTYLATALTTVGTNWLASGDLEKASDFFIRAKELSLTSGEDQTAAILGFQLGKMQRRLDNRDAEIAAYDSALNALNTLSSAKFMCELDQISDSSALLEEEMSRLTMKVPIPKGGRKGVTTRKASAKKGAGTTKNQIVTTPSVLEECRRLESLKGSLLRQKAGAFMLWKRSEQAVAALTEAESFSRTTEDAIDQNISIAKQLFLESLEQMSSHPVYSVLQDSTISFPAVIVSSKTATSTSERQQGVRLSPPRKLQVNSFARTSQRSKGVTSASCFEKLQQAYEHLKEAHSTAVQISSTSVIHSLSSLICTISTFISAGGQLLGNASIHPNFATCFMEMSRNIALDREHMAVLNDINCSQKENDLQWPAMEPPGGRQYGGEFKIDVAQFQKEYIDIIPEAWTVVSISLSESRQELCLTKMQCGNSPFILRLPLGRNNSRDVDEEVFDFDQGKTELLEIIELANDSSHGAKDLTGREEKTAWWSERTELDARLKDLLENIETVWLGGFKGIFSQHRAQPDLLTRFQKSFQNILEKHLPSRQNGSKKGKSARITLDIRVLELFIGLGQAISEHCDLDEALTDLLYFVVDILQFHGERNAYDEIDFDSIVIETHDALRSYHDAAVATSNTTEDAHTILILDKALHSFPWESLPCMDSLAVSRLPSLDCLRERILDKDSSSSSSPQRRYASRTSGSYILNPAGDLKTTQSTFEKELQSLSSWTGISKKEPTELEMQESLESKDIFLYFGHGSGAQYIRSKAIKRLKSCAVTILMGCSSGALTESGEFEPYGPPVDYMLAGCPALVATLWDITDKDIDRFAKRTFEQWGLFGVQPTHNERSGKGNSKRNVTQSQSLTNDDAKSLVKAVAEGRKACNFRYLTAAAVCVYGVPVYLK